MKRKEKMIVQGYFNLSTISFTSIYSFTVGGMREKNGVMKMTNSQ